MTKILVPFPKFRAFDATGLPLVGGKLFTYQAGTLTPLATFTDETGGSANTNPVILDSTGQANVWLSTSPYKFVLKDTDDVVLWTVDNIGARPPTIIDVVDYGAVGDGTTDDQPAFAAAAAAAGSWGTVLIPRPAVSYKLGSNVAASVFWIFMGSAAISGVGTLAGIQIQQLTGGALQIVNSSGVASLSLDSAGNWGLIGASFAFGGGPVTLDDSLIMNTNSAQAGKGIIQWSGGGSSTLDYGITQTQSFSFVDSQFTQSFYLGKNFVPAGLVSTQTNYSVGDSTTRKAYFGKDFISIGDGYIPNFGGTTFPASGIAIGPNTLGLSFNDGVSHSTTYPTNDFQMGLGHFFLGSGGSDCWVLMKKNGGSATSYGTVLTIDQNGCVGIGTCRAQVGGSSAQTIPGLYLKTDGSTSTNNTIVNDFAAGATSQKTIIVQRNSSEVGSIATTNTTTTYNTSSDYRLKEDLRPVLAPLAVVEKLTPFNFKWKVSDDRTDGFIAHEVQEFMPYAVQGIKDGEEMQQLDYSKLVPMLWAAVQALAAKVRELENKNA